ncbi:formate/nitrite transporter family protein [Sphingomonas sp. CROZ-RG-20F-R02-07]|uniref:formate/nitrite transporter family protein n=1 Tax=Sphingomonas sp. CROZ-RG-20F-R02-07 TaxID=2914832 RepID=UPI001F57EB09|nr:formate/nitrite transporter family protein [Sphingomonas sp. CROZ-RG-20F-R02-07]
MSDEQQPDSGLSDDEVNAVAQRKAGSAKVVHEVIRLQGDEELDRPLASLLFSAFAAGVAISASILAEASLAVRLPEAPWRELVVSLGYTVGFVLVILGNLQLFTETTVTAVLPLATHPTLRNLKRLLRLWAAVLLANLAGTFLVALLMAKRILMSADQLDAAIALSRTALDHGAGDVLLLGMPAGFLVASIAWILPNARGSEFWVVMLVTYLVAIGGFSHVVAGSGEAWLLVLTGRIPFSAAILGYILPSLAGNIIGGTGLFAVLAHGQVRPEIKD